MQYLVDSSLDFWLTYGDYSKKFEKQLSKYLGVRWAFLVNSGSSANLLAFYALTSPLLKERQVKRGDEVITVAAGFPTTVAPIVQYGAVPVFVDMDLTYANVDVTQLELALSPKTKAIMIAHSLGNPFNLLTPSFMPATGSPALSGTWVATTNASAVTYRGAFGTTDWTAGWANWDAQNTKY